MRGNLQLPEGAKIIEAEPGIIMEAQAGAQVWRTPPVYEGKTYKETDKTDLKVAPTDSVYIHSITQQPLISKFTFKTKTEVLVNDLPVQDPFTGHIHAHTQVAIVTLFEKQNTQEDKSRRERSSGMRKTGFGYMFKSDLMPYKHQFKKTNADIFPDHEIPRDTQVRQSSFSNCFLLSSISSILNKDAGFTFFQNMMVQTNDGHVIVRLFHPKTHLPVYLKVENSLYHEDKINKVLHTANWVHMIEKAYSGLGYRTKSNRIFQDDPSFYSTYDVGGHPEVAFKILTSEQATSKVINTRISLNKLLGLDLLREYDSLKKMVADCEGDADSAKNLLDKIKSLEEAIKKQPFLSTLDNLEAVETFGKYITTRSVKDLPPSLQGNGLFVPEKNAFIDIIHELIPDDYLDKPHMKTIKFAMIKFADKQDNNNQPIFPLGNYQGNYSTAELAVFNDIKTRLDKGEILVGSTPNQFFEPHTGMVTSHCYAILQTNDKKIVPEKPRVKFISVRNPWSSTARCYHWDKANTPGFVTENKELATFPVELRDFCRFFNYYTACPPLRPELVARKTTAKTPTISDSDINNDSDNNMRSSSKRKPK